MDGEICALTEGAGRSLLWAKSMKRRFSVYSFTPRSPARTRAGPTCPHQPGAWWDVRVAIARSTVYNVCMAVRAMQELTDDLTALANGSQHGYGIIIDVQEISGGLVAGCARGRCTAPCTACARTS